MSGSLRAGTTATRIHLFVYGTLRNDAVAAGLLAGCERLDQAAVSGVLYDMDGAYPALVLGGTGSMRGEVWRCPADALARLDEYEGVTQGLFRRVAVDAGGVPCWTYVAGPALAHRLTPDRRIETGAWRPPGRAS